MIDKWYIEYLEKEIKTSEQLIADTKERIIVLKEILKELKK